MTAVPQPSARPGGGTGGHDGVAGAGRDGAAGGLGAGAELGAGVAAGSSVRLPLRSSRIGALIFWWACAT